MSNKGNKSIKTIVSEEVFVNVMHVLGLNVIREVLFRNSFTGKRVVDFVVSKPYLKDGLSYCGMVGVELKTQREDLLYKSTGKSFNSFPFNYLLVTHDILDDAIKMIGCNRDYSHIGVIVLTDNSEIEIYKQAEYCAVNQEYYGELKSDIENYKYDEYCDSIACAFAEVGKSDYGTIHDFRNDITFKVKYEKFTKRTIENREETPRSGTIARMKIDTTRQTRMSFV